MKVDGNEHDFAESLKLSQEQADAPWWNEVYKAAFPTLQSAVCVRNDGWAQRGGIDRVLTLGCGKTLTVDEKVRSVDYGDILLEVWSDYEARKPGWVGKDLACDFIAYAIIPTATCYLLPFQTLRAAWRENGQRWYSDKNSRKIAPNKGYFTVSVAVSVDDLMQSMCDAMRVGWKAAA
jgi:hypothetical protein